MMKAHPDPRGQMMQIRTRRFSAPVSFDDVSPSDIKWIAFMTCLDFTAVLAYAEAEFSSLSLYTWEEEFF